MYDVVKSELSENILNRDLERSLSVCLQNVHHVRMRANTLRIYRVARDCNADTSHRV